MKRKFNWKVLGGAAMLLVITAVWGISFVFNKRAIAAMPTMYVLTLRFLPSALLVGAVLFPLRHKRLNKTLVWHGVLLGVMLFGAYAFQTFGLKYTTPARNSFITAIYCVLTPFVMWVLYKQKPHSYNLLAAAMCMAGLALIVLSGEKDGEYTYLLGDMLTLACAGFYVMQIVFIGRFHEKDDVLWLLFFELLTVGVLCGIGAVAVELPLYGPEAFVISKDMVVNLLFLTLAATLFAQLGQIVGQKYSSPNQAAIILSLESVFGALFSVLMGEEKLTGGLIGGFVLIFVAVLWSETKFDLLKLLKRLFAPKPEVAQEPADIEDMAHKGAIADQVDDLPQNDA